jgi:hypothetical protein
LRAVTCFLRTTYHVPRTTHHAPRIPHPSPTIYTTCLHCHADLGRNESLELFPVGRRLAFDQAKLRLWAVCTKCGRWNLSPLDERGAVIEGCEKLYRDTVLRRSTGEVGLARLPSGLELVRIGRPIFPEYADWRYGERFKRRKWISRATTVVGIGAALGLTFGLPAATAALGFGAMGGNWTYQLWAAWRNRIKARRVIGTYYTSFDRPPERLLGLHLDGLTVEATAPTAWRLELPKIDINWLEANVKRKYRHNVLGVTWGEIPDPVRVAPGDETRLLSDAIHRINASGGSGEEVMAALKLYDADRGDLFGRIGNTAHQTGKAHRLNVVEFPEPIRLALEIQLAEKRDTAWLDGELASLAAAWKEAEAIAAIADTLTGPEWIDAELEEGRRQRRGG